MVASIILGMDELKIETEILGKALLKLRSSDSWCKHWGDAMAPGQPRKGDEVGRGVGELCGKGSVEASSNLTR